MTTLTAIANAIRDILIDLEDIDLATLDGYLPAVETQKVALLIPPMGLRGSVGAPVGHKTRLVHRIPLEFWVRVDNGDLAACLRRAREVCLNAAAELQANLTLQHFQGGHMFYTWETSRQQWQRSMQGFYQRALG